MSLLRRKMCSLVRCVSRVVRLRMFVVIHVSTVPCVSVRKLLLVVMNMIRVSVITVLLMVRLPCVMCRVFGLMTMML